MKSLTDIVFVRHEHVCPWYCCFTFDNIFRRWCHDPQKILSQYIKPGDTVLDMGPGQGYFSIPMAKIVGERGRVIAIDIQQKMLDMLKRKAEKAGVAERITCIIANDDDLGLNGNADFVLAFWMVHEVPEKERFLKSIYSVMKHGKCLLVAEPYLHVSKKMMEETIQTAQRIGFKIDNKPNIFFSRSVVLIKN